MLPAGSDLHILLRGLLDPEALFLLREAAVEARRLYADLIDPAAPLPTKDPPRPGSIYLIAFSAKNLVGCGALRKIDATTGGGIDHHYLVSYLDRWLDNRGQCRRQGGLC
jgi:hypothetical protein